MHVPYSMDDNEPDLYGSLGGSSSYNDDWDTQTKWESNTLADSFRHSTTYNPVIVEQKLYNQSDMDKVIQHNLKAVRAAYDEGFNDGWTEGNENCQHR